MQAKAIEPGQTTSGSPGLQEELAGRRSAASQHQHQHRRPCRRHAMAGMPVAGNSSFVIPF